MTEATVLTSDERAARQAEIRAAWGKPDPIEEPLETAGESAGGETGEGQPRPLKDVQEEARALEIVGRSKMDREELESAIAAHHAETDAAAGQ